MSVTFVSAFFRLPDRAVDEDEQFRRFDELAAGGAEIFLFLDVGLADRAPTHRNVYVFPTRLAEVSLFELYAGAADLDLPKYRDQAKDTRDFLLLQNEKIHFLLRASMIDAIATHFAWIDFGVTKISKDPQVFARTLAEIDPPETGVFAPGCWLQPSNEKGRVDWRFCGGFLLSDRESLPALADAHREAFDVFARNGLLTWEVNVWASMERVGFPFNWYKADHDDSLIDMPKKSDKKISPMSIIGNHTPRICLNMILGNESKIIERCLAAALPTIDTWCIACNGTDDTAEKVEEFFRERSVQGIRIRIEFHDFAQARNAALTAAYAMPAWEYALLVDADMVLTGTLDKSALVAPAYELVQRNGHLDYPNTRLVRRDSGAKYVGVTHEFISVEGVVKMPDIGAITTLVIEDRDDGGNKSDKGPRDIRLLRQGLVDEPSNERYMFYLAQTYRETGAHREAIHWYRRRIARGGWEEEVWFAYYGIACSYKELANRLYVPDTRHPLSENEPFDNESYDSEARFVKACFDAHNNRPSRGEPIKMLAQFYREKGRNESALLLANALAGIEYPGAELFVERGVYDFGAAQEIAISGFYSKSPKMREAGYNACAKLTIHSDDNVRNEARRNFTFYAKSAAEMFGAHTDEIGFYPPVEVTVPSGHSFKLREIDLRPENGWAPMNPSVCIGPNVVRLVLVRTVNYEVADGQYPTIDGSGIIKTKNYIVEMDEEWNALNATLIEDVSDRELSKFPVEGFEDCRLWYGGDKYFMSTTIRDAADNLNGNCEIAIVPLDEQWRAIDVSPVRDYEGDKTQKNWMPIIGHPGVFLYFCDPTIVIDAGGANGRVQMVFGSGPIGPLPTAEISRYKPTACLLDLRGGSQLIPHNDGWLCLTHEVAWRPERVYLHRFVFFNEAFQITKISDPFYFKHVGIEFCAGLARDGDELVASFGVNDASAHLAFFDPASVDRSLKTL